MSLVDHYYTGDMEISEKYTVYKLQKMKLTFFSLRVCVCLCVKHVPH